MGTKGSRLLSATPLTPFPPIFLAFSRLFSTAHSAHTLACGEACYRRICMLAQAINVNWHGRRDFEEPFQGGARAKAAKAHKWRGNEKRRSWCHNYR